MEKDKVIFYLKGLSKILNISLIYVSNGEVVANFQPFVYKEKENQADFIVNRLKPVINSFDSSKVFYDINKFLIFIGVITKKNKTNDDFVLVGPIASNVTSDQNILQYLFESGLDLNTCRNLTSYLSRNKFMSFEQFLDLLLNINLILNDEPISLNEFINISKNQASETEIIENNRITTFENEYNNEEKTNTIERENYNKKLNFCMKNGLVELLPSLLSEMGKGVYSDIDDVYSRNDLKRKKYLAIGATFAAENIGIDAGISTKKLEDLKQYFLNRIDIASTPAEIQKISIDIIFEFTKLIRDNRSYVTNNPTVNKVIDYIQANITTKLTAQNISDNLKISINYLFTSFKKETNMTLVDFITKEKIKKSEQLLLFTNKELIEIAYYLGFSSQSYFQTTFKKIKGMTPTEYRKQTANGKI